MDGNTTNNTGITHISDTALWVAVYRAMETKRKDALFHDPYAEILAGDRGKRIIENMKDGKTSAWSMIVRTVVIEATNPYRIAVTVLSEAFVVRRWTVDRWNRNVVEPQVDGQLSPVMNEMVDRRADIVRLR